MNVQFFENTQDMFDAIQRGVEQAQARTTPKQAAITYGDYWMRFWDTGYGEVLLIFGYITPFEEMMQTERDLGADDEELAYERDMMKANYERGFRFGRAFSVVEPDGELGETHVSAMIPITKEEFDEARAVRWIPAEIDKLSWFNLKTLESRV